MLVKLAAASWLSKEDKICNLRPDSGPLLYTGFKIHREYKLSWLPPLAMHFMTLSHCDHGKVDYQKTLRTRSSADIDWERPFCMFKPDLGSRLKLKPLDTIRNIDGREKSEEHQGEDALYRKEGLTNSSEAVPVGIMSPGIQRTLLTESSSQTKGSSQQNQTLKHKLAAPEARVATVSDRNGMWEVLKHNLDKLLQRATAGAHFQYWGERKMLHLEDMQSSNIGASLEWESRNLVCYKMARRRKYARRNFLFYMPYTFVGVLYECPVSSATKHAIFQNFSNTAFLQSFDFECDQALAVPVKPLIADDSTRQWFSHKASRFSSTQHIPYLTTASLLDVRFAASNTLDMHDDTWASKVDVNEDYNYSEADISLISETVAWCTDYLNKLLIRPSFKMSRFNSLRSHALESEDPLFGTMEVDQRILLALQGLSRSEALVHLKSIQEKWDENIA